MINVGRRGRTPRKAPTAQRLRIYPPAPHLPPISALHLTETTPVGSNWLFQMKFDGYRGQVAIAGDIVVVYTRNRHDWTEQFRVILKSLRKLTKAR